MWEFKKISMEDGELLKKYLINDNNLCCEFSFANNVLWNSESRLEFQIVEDVLVYRMVYDEKIVYCTPDFKGKPKQILDFINANAESIGKNYIITNLNEKMVQEIKGCDSNHYEFATNRDYSDYIYLVDNLANLTGKKYHKKKNHLNKFLKSYEFTYEEINADNRDECREMKDIWMANHDMSSQSLQIESKAIDDALNHFEEFDFLGGLIRVEGVVKAFTLGERLSSDTFVTHFEKALDEVNGIYAVINQQFAKNALQGKYIYVNREEDMGLLGLRQAKLSYYPEIVYDKYMAWKNA